MAFTRMYAVFVVCFLSVQATAASLEEDDLTSLLQKGIHQSKKHSSFEKGKGQIKEHASSSEPFLTSLLQKGIHQSKKHSSLEQGKGQIKEHASSSEPFDCASYPEFCQEPFNCDKDAVAPPPTKGDLHRFCGWIFPPPRGDNGEWIKTCVIDNDLVRSAYMLYNNTIDDPKLPNEDASYCFINGLCIEEAVTNSTTVTQADAICEDRFGDQFWTPLLDFDFDDSDYDVDGSILKGDLATTLLKMACKSGSYQCDVMYCRETYCKNPHFLNKFGHILVDYGWMSQEQLDEYKKIFG